MYCKNCGKEIDDNAKFCPDCGTPAAGGIKEPETQAKVPEARIEEPETGTEELDKSSPEQRKNKKKTGIVVVGMLVVVAAVIAAAVLILSGGSGQETIQKLSGFTTLYKSDPGYSFDFSGEWELHYTEENEAVRIAVPDALSYLAETFGVSDLGDDGTCSYNPDSGNINIYCEGVETEDGNLSSITYNVNDDAFTFIIGGDRYEPVGEFAEAFDESLVSDSLLARVQYFEGILLEYDLTVDDVMGISYDDVEKYVKSNGLELSDSAGYEEAPDTSSEPKENAETEIEENETVEETADDAEAEINEETSGNLLTDPVTMGWGGAYIDDDSGDRLIIALVGYEYSYRMYTSSGEIFQEETNCSPDIDYMYGQYYTFAKNENGLLGVTSGAGGLWGNYRRVSGTLDPDGSIEGTYGDEDTSIIVSDQMAKVTDDYVPGGADIATVTVHYNNGLTLEGRLYTQQDSSLAVVDPATNLVQGIMTFEDGKVTVAGSGFDGTYQKVG